MSNKMVHPTDTDILAAFNDEEKITQAIREGIQHALMQHKQAGNAICEWKDNQVHWILAEQINIKKT